MDKPKRAYYLPAKLIAAFDKEAAKHGYVREKVVAAAMFTFLESEPRRRAQMLNNLDEFLHGKAR
ncbi:MAG TPA: hypothetical protein PKY77_18565 [Phycisphaerae bacterium]|nr:hypothetical protein [Phycisphaerae bacterium]HRY69130.1 hypothetical protein [Phycisphaerae bacterium]HSA26091.1 hypothetical protein [Phycisphaerae bacterium]